MKSTNYYKQQILKHSYENQLAHVSSCLNAVEVLRDIYLAKKLEDKVVLSCGHAYLALRVILEDLGLDVPKDLRTHPDKGGDVHCSTGSLGCGFPMALGMALARPEIVVHCVTSDGEWAEGSMWESLRLMVDLHIKNIFLCVIANGFSAYGEISLSDLERRINGFFNMRPVSFFHSHILFCRVPSIPFLEGLTGHYKKINEEEYKILREYYQEH